MNPRLSGRRTSSRTLVLLRSGRLGRYSVLTDFAPAPSASEVVADHRALAAFEPCHGLGWFTSSSRAHPHPVGRSRAEVLSRIGDVA